MHQKTLEEAKKRLFSGRTWLFFPLKQSMELVQMPTIDQEAIQLIYKTKKRPISNPLICHFANIK